LQSIKNIDSIKFEKSISMFHDINDLVIIFHKKNTANLLSGSTSLTDIKNRTKKVFINHNSKKKTRRKELKDTSI